MENEPKVNFTKNRITWHTKNSILFNFDEAKKLETTWWVFILILRIRTYFFITNLPLAKHFYSNFQSNPHHTPDNFLLSTLIHNFNNLRRKMNSIIVHFSHFFNEYDERRHFNRFLRAAHTIAIGSKGQKHTKKKRRIHFKYICCGFLLHIHLCDLMWDSQEEKELNEMKLLQ